MKKTLRFVLFGLLALVLTAAVAIFLIAKVTLAPATGEWATQVKAGPLNMEVSVPAAIRVATSPWFAPWLDGRSMNTGYGTLHFAWNPRTESLELRCA
ncbi:MAG: glycosyl transferase, partial [Comamonadaceae bacterium]